MRKQALGLLAISLFAASGVQAATYVVLNTSYIDSVARIGGRSIPEIETFSNQGGCGAACTGSLDPTNPLNWPLFDRTMSTQPTYTNGVCTAGCEANFSNVNGVMDVTAGSVTTATLFMLNGRLSFGTFQTATTISDLVSGDPTVNQTQATQGPAGSPLHPLVWTFNSALNTLPHQTGGGTAMTSNNTTACVIVVGAGTTGQCGQLAGAINASGVTGGVNTNNSVWNWTGIAANYIVNDGATVPWHTATGANINVTPNGALPGVVWDLTGFVDGVGGTIKARVYADALAGAAGGSGSAVTALYTLTVVAPVPAAVWLMGSALGLLGWIRRRSQLLSAN